MDVIDPRVWWANPMDLVRQLAELGERDEAVAILRSYVAVRGGRNEALPQTALHLRDEETLRKLAAHDDSAVECLAEFLIHDRGVEAAEAAILTLPERMIEVGGRQYSLGVPHRLSFAWALHRTGHEELAEATVRAMQATSLEKVGDLPSAGRLLTEILLARGDLDTLQAMAVDVRNRLSWTIADGLADHLLRRGDVERLQQMSEDYCVPAWDALAELSWRRGEHERVVQLADRGSTRAQSLLVTAAADAGDRAALEAYTEQNFERAAESLVDLFARQGDVVALSALSDGGSLPARGKLIPLLDRRGDVRGLAGIAAGPVDPGDDRALATALVRHGLTAEAGPVLRRLIPDKTPADRRRRLEAFADAGDLEGFNREMFILRHGALHGAPAETMAWVALAVASGVLGNAAYAGLTAAVSTLWDRIQAKPSVSQPPYVAPRDNVPEWHTARGALDAACLAVHEHCTRIDVPVPDFATVSYDVQHSNGRWVFLFREQGSGHRRFQVGLGPNRGDGTTVVMIGTDNWGRRS